MAMVSTPSGRVSRASLALPTSYVAPEGELETLIVKIFAEVFNLDWVGVNDDFFDLGGDSLIAETLSMLLSERTTSSFPVSCLLEYGSPRRVAEFLGADRLAAPTLGSDKGVRPPIFMVHGRGGFMLPKPEFRDALAPGQTLRMFELPGIRGGNCYERIEDIAAVYVSELKEEYPQGPILLAAFCAGSLIALEMAAQLTAIGRPPRHLVLIDPPVRKDGRLGVDRKRFGRFRLQDWMRSKLRRLGAIVSPHGQQLLKDANYADDVMMYRAKLLDRKQHGLLKYSEFNLSIEARAKLHAAYLHYRPAPYHKPATILLSRQREAEVREAPEIDKFLPDRRYCVVAEKHLNIANAAASDAMQAAFDTALAEVPATATNCSESLDPAPGLNVSSEIAAPACSPRRVGAL
jgi:thioesterase domain-containing protein